MQRAEHLIIGGGVAGTVAAETIRTKQPDARIVIVSAEDHPLYSRVLLPNYIKGKIPREKVFLRQWPQYGAKGIEVLRGRRMTSFDPAAHTATLDDGSVWEYGGLLLATGRQPDPPPDLFPDRGTICVFRTLEDADKIRQVLATLAAVPEGGRRAVIVGAGYIALEFGPFFRMVGAETHLVMRAKRFWEKVVTEHGSKVMEDLLATNGVIIHREAEVASREDADDGRHRLTLTTGVTLDAAAIGLGLGIEERNRSIGQAGVKTGDGVVVDEYLQTNQSDVFAAGDNASFNDLRSGRHVRLGNWQNADLQGRVAGENMCGARRAFDNVSQYSTKIFETVVAMAGDVSPDGPPPRVVSREGAHIELRERDDVLIGAVMIGLVPERGAILAAIKNKQKSPV